MKTETCSSCGAVFNWDNSAIFARPASGWLGYFCNGCAKERADQRRFEESERTAKERAEHAEWRMHEAEEAEKRRRSDAIYREAMAEQRAEERRLQQRADEEERRRQEQELATALAKAQKVSSLEMQARRAFNDGEVERALKLTEEAQRTHGAVTDAGLSIRLQAAAKSGDFVRLSNARDDVLKFYKWNSHFEKMTSGNARAFKEMWHKAAINPYSALNMYAKLGGNSHSLYPHLNEVESVLSAEDKKQTAHLTKCTIFDGVQMLLSAAVANMQLGELAVAQDKLNNALRIDKNCVKGHPEERRLRELSSTRHQIEYARVRQEDTDMRAGITRVEQERQKLIAEARVKLGVDDDDTALKHGKPARRWRNRIIMLATVTLLIYLFARW